VLVDALRDTPRVHLVGLVSHGGVHASMKHLRGLLELARGQGTPDVVVHAFTDGRDTAPDSGAGCLAELEGWMAETGGRVGSVTGRYYAMDRDRRWERTRLAYDAIVHGQAEHRATTGEEAVRAAYERGETDEFVRPVLVGEEARVRPGDSVAFFGFRPDRARQLTRALAEPGFDGFDRGGAPAVERLATLAEYQEGWPYPVAFPPARPEVTLASVLSERGVEQLHVAETEKYAHVTYFFNGGEEAEHPGEERRLVDSPRDVPTYDRKPEMSAREAAAAFVERWREGSFGFGIINFANPDMVGHTGVIPAAVKAVETVDECLGRVVEAVHEKGGACLITADHGNADEMLEPDGSPDTAHSLNPVPVVVTAEIGGLRRKGVLADVAPTLLDLMGQEQPEEMTGASLRTEKT
ncbi:MAG: 2,3-bisphosphoglycerate-independent phosphoglycerate mutase, partial [Actinomycetota bacterium]|nr:2,3-bisphosphoglycerate-independent phosphoglycerate mutase [Actinomycetota bacterium]